MTTIAHIICPVDLSLCSRRALQYAFTWAQWHRARVLVLYVELPPTPLVEPGSDGIILLRRPAADIEADVRRFVSDVPNPGVEMTIEIREGDPATVIREVADRDTHAIVVMGTHGRTGLNRLMLGSTTEQVAHRTGRPLLVVPPHEDAAAEPRATFERLLCAVDFRASSLAALRSALALAHDNSAQLDVVTVLETLHDDEARELRPYGAAEYRIVRSQELLRELRDAIPGDLRAGLTIREQVLTGSPATEVLRHAKEARADLIVLGTGERLHFGTSWLGRTTDRVMRQATCPVFVVPAQRRLIAQDAAPLGPERWAQVFDRVTLQHQGEPTTVSILGDVMGVEVEAAARPLVALTSESRFGEHSIAVILGMPDGTHLTHFVVKPTEVRIGEARDHHNVELLITALDGTTTVVDVGAAHPS